MQFNVAIYLFALFAVVHGAAIGVRAPSLWSQIAKPKSGDPPSASAPKGGVAPSTAAKQWGCLCGDIRYSSTQVALAVAAAKPLENLSVGPASDPAYKKFPHPYDNDEGLDFSALCPGEDLTEFPLLLSGTYSAASSKGEDRVVYSKSSGKFCGCIHHTTGRSFEKCTLV